ncbi:hypothetical protein FRB95_004223 [Tulasnella sp. JGI-2019a]|nr:hypothetical protein FRB95_004223 [Tulasnella sp. JGI-2019a]
MTPGGRYLLTAMEDLSVLCWDLDKELTEPEVLVPKGPLFHETLVSFAADRLATHELLNFVLQTADGVVDIWSFDVPSMSEKRCTHNGSIRLESVAECVHLCGDVFSGYLINTGCAVSFSWKTLITDGQIHEYSSLRLPRECRDVCHLSTGQVLVVDSEEVALYPPPPYLSVSNIRRAEHSTTMAPIWRLERRMVDYMYQIIPGRLPGVESELIGTIVSENLLMDLFATDDGSVAVTTTNFDPNVQDVAVGTYRAATARTEDGVTDAWYLRRFSLSTSNSRASARLIAHPEVKLQYPEGIITPHRRVTLQWRLDEQSGRALYFVQSLKGESHLIVLDFA